MKRQLLFLATTILTLAPGAGSAIAAPALTIYNQNFAVVRDQVALDLKQGDNHVRFSGTTAHLEPDSVILRDPQGQANLQILEQNYRNDPVSQELLLSFYEGKTIDFLVTEPNKPNTIVQGKIVRSGYVPHSQQAIQRYGQRYAMEQSTAAFPQGAPGQPIIEVDGKLRFSLPGQPLFPPLADDAILKPTLEWQLHSDKAAKVNAEIGYITGGMSWEADYNVVAAEKSDLLEVVGWITIDNQSGKTFNDATIKLMAGDVSKIQRGSGMFDGGNEELAVAKSAAAPVVGEKAFEDYHLYTLARPATLRDSETKQVEFIRAEDVKSDRIYVYDGLKVDNRWSNYGMENIRSNQEIGTDSDTKVAIMREFKNSTANHLGLPLPKGRMRFYKQDSDQQLEFTGENLIDHTPKDETLRIYTGNAFDLVGERIRTNVKTDAANHWLDESFEIKLRNHKKEAAEIRVVEHLYRWTNWTITAQSTPFTKTDAQKMECRVTLQPDEEKKLTYTVHYSW